MPINNNDDLNIKIILDRSQIDTSITGLKKSFRELSGLAGSSVLSPDDKNKILVRMGEIQNKIMDTRKVIRSLDDDNVFENMASLMTPLTASFTAAGSALSLFGIENEKINDILVKTTQLTVALSSLQQVADARKLKSMVMARAEQLKNFVIDKLTFNISKQQAAANIAEATTKGGVTIATKMATKAQLAWNAAVKSNPIMLLISAIALLVIGIIALSKAFGKNTEEVKEYEKTLDGTVIKDEKLRESHNETIKTLRDLQIEYQVLSGTLSETAAEAEKTYNEMNDGLYNLKIQQIKELEEIEDKYDGFWHGILVSAKAYFIGIRAYAEDDVKRMEEENKVKEKFISQENDIKSIADQKIKNILLKSQQELNKKINDFQVDRLKKTIVALSKEYDAAKSSAEKIISIYENINEKIGNITIDIMPEGLEKDLAKLEQSSKKSTLEFNKQNDELEKEILNLNEIKNKYVLLETQLKAYASSYKLIGTSTTTEINNLKDTNNNINKNVKSYEQQNTELQNEIDLNNELIKQHKDRLHRLETKEMLEGFNIRKPKIEEEKRLLDELISKNNINNSKILNNNTLINKGTTDILLNENKISELSIQQTNNKNEQLDIEQQIKDIQKEGLEVSKKINEVQSRRLDISFNNTIAEVESQKLIEKQKAEAIKNSKKQVEAAILEANTQIFNSELEINKIRQENYNNTIKNDRSTISEKEDAWNKLKELYTQQMAVEYEIGENKKKQLQSIYDEKKANLEQIDSTIKRLELIKDLTKDQQAILDDARKRRMVALTEMDSILKQIGLEDEQIKQIIDNIAKQIESKPLEVNIKPKVKIKWGKFEMDEDEFKSNVLDTIGQLMTGVGDLIGERISQTIENEMTRLDKYYDSEYTSLENLKNAELITEQEYNDKKLKLDEEKAKKEKELKIKQFKAEQQAAIIQVAINAAVGIMKAWATEPLTAPFMTAIIAAQAAIEAALIKAQPIPEYELGGKIIGPPHKQGGVPITAEGGEYIVRKEIVKRPGVEKLLNNINSGYYTNGGLIKNLTDSKNINNIYNNNNYNTSSITNSLNEEMIRKIVQEVISIPVINVETEYTQVQRKVQSIEKRRLF